MDDFIFLCSVIGLIASIITITQSVRALGRYIAKRSGLPDAATSDKPDADCISNH